MKRFEARYCACWLAHHQCVVGWIMKTHRLTANGMRWHFHSGVGRSKTKRKKLLTNSYFSVTVCWLRRETTPKSEKGFHLNPGTQAQQCYGTVPTQEYMISDAWVKSIFVADQLQSSLIERLTWANFGLLGQKTENVGLHVRLVHTV